MPAENGYKVAVVILDQHEPEGEATSRLLEIAQEKGYSPRVVEAQRGEHDAGLSFRVPEDVAQAFTGERADLWPDDEAKRVELGHVAVDGSTRDKPGPDDETMFDANPARDGEPTKIENDGEKVPTSRKARAKQNEE
jgi:hypothetical protein